MFWNKKNNNETLIITRVTKTSSQSKYEKEIENKAEQQSCICPECGYNNKYLIFLPCKYENTDINVLDSTCEKCGTEWRTEYRL